VLQLRFFASLREQLGRSAMPLPLPPGCADIAALVAHLDAAVLPGCAGLLLADNTLIAVNRVVCARDAAVADGDEVAFYPPVTGG
jgi:molybdopterin synthase sulfur carrier subunit